MASQIAKHVESIFQISFDRIVLQQIRDQLHRSDWIVPQKSDGCIAVVTEKLPYPVPQMAVIYHQHTMWIVRQ